MSIENPGEQLQKAISEGLKKFVIEHGRYPSEAEINAWAEANGLLHRPDKDAVVRTSESEVIDRARNLLEMAADSLTSDNFETRDYVQGRIREFLQDHPPPDKQGE